MRILLFGLILATLTRLAALGPESESLHAACLHLARCQPSQDGATCLSLQPLDITQFSLTGIVFLLGMRIACVLYSLFQTKYVTARYIERQADIILEAKKVLSNLGLTSASYDRCARNIGAALGCRCVWLL